jgi:hypothetical protein
LGNECGGIDLWGWKMGGTGNVLPLIPFGIGIFAVMAKFVLRTNWEEKENKVPHQTRKKF